MRSETLKYDLAYGLLTFDESVSSTQVGSRDLSEIFPDCRRLYVVVN